ncbi:MAG: hypothetical protein AAF636_11010 [Pseudomonadota bacterium]
MTRLALLLTGSLAFLSAPAVADSSATRAIESFNAVCFKAGQTADAARTRMQARDGDPLPYALTFWDKTLQPAPGTPDFVERRCAVRMAGEHTRKAIAALRVQMAKPPVFGRAIALPASHKTRPGTALIEGRELLRGRIAVVHIGFEKGQTYMAVDRLPADWQAKL